MCLNQKVSHEKNNADQEVGSYAQTIEWKHDAIRKRIRTQSWTNPSGRPQTRYMNRHCKPMYFGGHGPENSTTDEVYE